MKKDTTILDETIVTLENRITVLENDVNRLGKLKTQASADITKLLNDIAYKEGILVELNKHEEEKEAVLLDLAEQTAVSRETLDKLNDQASVERTTLEALAADVHERERVITEREQEVTKRTLENNEQETAIRAEKVVLSLKKEKLQEVIDIL